MSSRTELFARLYSNDVDLTVLDLKDSAISDLVAESLCDALKVNNKVTHVDLSCNNLTPTSADALCDVLRLNKTITRIDLSDNFLDSESVVKFSRALEANAVLQALVVRGNLGVSVASESDLHIMIQLNTKPNHFKDVILKLRTQKEAILDLSVDPVEFRDVGGNTSAHLLDDWCITVLAKTLESNKWVQRLLLRNHHITDVGATALANMLRANTVLDEIDLFGNAISRAGVLHFMDALTTSNNSLRKLNLFHNVASDATLVELAQVIALNSQPMRLKKYLPLLKANDAEVVELSLDEHMSQRTYTDLSVKLLSEACMENTVLQTLELAHNAITRVGCEYISSLLATPTVNLISLTLDHNPIGSAGLGLLSAALLRNTKLTTLRCHNCGIAEDGVDALLEVIYGAAPQTTNNNTLTSITLSGNAALTDKVAGKFLRMYRKDLNRALHDVDWRDTSVTSHMLSEIVIVREMRTQPECLRTVMSNPPEVLELSNCQLHDDNINVLVALLKSNSKVIDIDISHNNIGYAGLKRIFSAMVDNRYAAVKLNISGNDLGRNGSDLVIDLLDNHYTLEYIDLRNTGLGTAALTDIIFYLADQKHRKMKTVFVGEKHIADETYQQQVDLYVKCHVVPSHEFKKRVRGLYEAYSLISTYPPDMQRMKLEIPFDTFTNYILVDEENDFSLGHGKRGVSHDNSTAVITHMRFMFPDLFKHSTAFIYRGNALTDAGVQALIPFFENGNVTVLDFENNELTDACVPKLCEIIHAHSKITKCNLTGNKLSPEGEEAIEIALSFNKLPTFAITLIRQVSSGATNLLDLCNDSVHENLKDVDISHLTDALEANPRAVYVNISHHHITEKGFAKLLNACVAHPSVHTIVAQNILLSRNTIGVLLHDFLVKNKVVKVFDLSYNEVGDNDVARIIDALKSNSTVRKIEVKDCGVGKDMVSDLNAALSLNFNERLKDACNHVTTVDTLDLSASKLDDVQTRPILKEIESAPNFLPLVALDLSKNSLGDVSGVRVFQALQRMPQLTTLNLSFNKLSTDTAIALAEFVPSHSCLNRIWLQANLIDNVGARALKSFALSEKRLHEIDVSDNLITEPGVAKCIEQLYLNQFSELLTVFQSNGEGDRLVVEYTPTTHHQEYITRTFVGMIAHNTVITHVAFTAPCISDIEVEEIAAAMQVNSSVQTLSLKHGITDHGARVLASMLQVNKTITSLDLSGNQISGDVVDAFRHTFLYNFTLVALDVSNNVMEERHRIEVQRLVDVNAQFPAFKPIINRALNNDEELTIIDFSKESLNDVGSSILVTALWENTNVTELDLSNASVTEQGVRNLLRLFQHNPTVSTLKMQNCPIVNNISGEFVDAVMFHIHSLRVIDFSNSNITDWTLERLRLLCFCNSSHISLKRAMVSLLQKDSSLKALNLRDVAMTDAHVEVFCQLLATDLNCRKIDFSRNQIGETGMKALAEMLCINTEGIQELNLAENEISQGIAVLCAKPPPSITAVDLSGCGLTDSNYAPLKDWLHKRPMLTRLAISSNPKMASSNRDNLLFYLQLNKEHEHSRSELLRVVDDGKNDIGFGGMKSYGAWSAESMNLICLALQRNHSVTSLDLSFNDIESKHLPRLLKELGSGVSCQSLREIHLQHNLLQDISELSAYLETNQSVTYLNLSHNRLGVPAAKDLARCLRTNKTLKHIEAEQERWGEAGEKVICEGVKENQGLERLDISGGDVSEKVLEDVLYEVSKRRN